MYKYQFNQNMFNISTISVETPHPPSHARVFISQVSWKYTEYGVWCNVTDVTR